MPFDPNKPAKEPKYHFILQDRETLRVLTFSRDTEEEIQEDIKANSKTHVVIAAFHGQGLKWSTKTTVTIEE